MRSPLYCIRAHTRSPDRPPTHTPPFRCAGEDGCKQVASSSSIYLGYMYMYLDILTKLFIYFFPFGFMIPCLQPDSASEQKEKTAGCVSYPPGTYLADRLVFCEPVTCTVPEKHDAGIMRIGNCFNAYCIYLASKQADHTSLFLLRVATRIEKARSKCMDAVWSRLGVYMGRLMMSRYRQVSVRHSRRVQVFL